MLGSPWFDLEEDLFRVTVRHRGRSGDGDLSLVALRFRFEESPGVPLTEAQFDAVVFALEVYRDDGDLVFEPGADLLVDAERRGDRGRRGGGCHHLTHLEHDLAWIERLAGGVGRADAGAAPAHRAGVGVQQRSLSAPQQAENAVSGSPAQASVCQTEKVAPQQIPQHSEHDFAPRGASTRDESPDASDGEPDPKSSAEPTLRDVPRRRTRMCSVRGGRRKYVPNELGNRRSILLSYGRARAG